MRTEFILSPEINLKLYIKCEMIPTKTLGIGQCRGHETNRTQNQVVPRARRDEAGRKGRQGN